MLINSGYLEYIFIWEIGLWLWVVLNVLGVWIVLLCGNDNVFGLCVDECVNMVNVLCFNVIVSLYVDGGLVFGCGFYVNYLVLLFNVI